MTYCRTCNASLTSTDYQAGACTQCWTGIAKETTTMTSTTHTNDCVRQAAKFGSRSLKGNQCSCSGGLPEIVKRTLVETVTDIGQLSKSDLYQLNKYVKRGWLSRGKGGPYPILKTVYAHLGFDFAASRERYVEQAMAIYEVEKRLRASGYFDPASPNYGKSKKGKSR